MAKLGELISQIDGRLTLTSGSPVTTSDVTAATTIYFTPYKGNHIALYNEDFEDWRLHNFTELSYSLAGIAADTNFDVFVYNNAGTLSLEIVAWSGATTRATALAVQDGVYVKSGEPARRYLGTFRTTSTIGQCEDSEAKRFCWNYHNQVPRRMSVTDTTTSWTYSTGAWRSANNSASNRIEIVAGVSEYPIKVSHYGRSKPSATAARGGYHGIGLDKTSGNDAGNVGYWRGDNTVTTPSVTCTFNDYVIAGYHYFQAVEYAESGEVYFYGTWDSLSKHFELFASVLG